MDRPNDDGEDTSAWWSHTKILLGKNLKLKRQQYLIPTKMFKLPIPLSATVEFVLPLAIVFLLTYIKTLTDIDVFPEGWGGDVPQGILDVDTACVSGLEYRWMRATQPDQDRVASCRPYTEVVDVIEPFFRLLTQLHALEHVKIAMAAESQTDVPKVRRMREWISRVWYPRQELADVPCMAGEIIAGDIGWDRGAAKEASLRGAIRNCTHHGVNPGVLSSFEDVSYLHGSGTAAELQDYLESEGYMVAGPRIYAALVFHSIPGRGDPGEDGDWNYSIRMNFTHADITTTYLSPTRHFARGIQTYYALQYALDGFSTFQLMIDRYIINRRVETDAALVLANNGFDRFEVDARYKIDLISAWTPESMEQAAEPMRYEPQIVQVLPVPSAGHRRNIFYSIVKNIFALLYVLLFMYSVFSIIATLVEEKETRVREMLRMMSVQTPSLVLSWYITYGAVFVVLNIMLTGSSTIGWGLGVFTSTSTSVLFAFFFLFSASSIGYAYLVHTFFDQAKTGGVVGMLGFFSSYFLYTAFRSEETSVFVKHMVSFFSPCAFAYGIDGITQFEEVEVGVHWSNVHEKVKGVSVMDSMWMMFLDAVLYSLLGLYFEQVLPKQYGATRHPLFPFELCGLKTARTGASNASVDASEDGSHGPQPQSDSFEPVNLPNVQQLEREGKCVKLKQLRKVFDTPDGKKIAVNALEMTLYQGQIFVLLGHNGAGKTTTINMLTGLYEPTSGDAEVYGRSIVADMMGVRKLIGICPQHDVLFLTLTVSEHLHFYAALRGVPEDQRARVVTQKIAQVGLTEKAAVRAGSLSGGMKRKLSLAISLVGESKAVFLDEPTSGMDPYSRRSTWNTLQSEKDGRVMILTTHFMEEADLLGDRIGIMAEGELRCCGSPLFLKRRFGQGYTLSVTRSSSCVVKTLQDTVIRLVPGAVLTSAVGTEVMFKLPVSAVDQFPPLLKILDEDDSLGVDQTGVSITTMEEVFCNIASEADTANQDAMLADSGENASNNLHRSPQLTAGSKIETMSPTELFALHFKAMFLKRWQYGKRDHIAIAFTTVLPVCMLFAGLILLKYGEVDGTFGNQPLRPLVMSQFHEDCEQHNSCDTPNTRVPFLVTSDRWGEHPERTREVESRLQAQPRLDPMPVNYNGSLETGHQWKYGVLYEDGLPTCDTPVYRPRADMSDWTDPRHRYFEDQPKIADPGVCLAFTDQVYGMGDGSDDQTGITYGSLLFHDGLDQSRRDICHMPGQVFAPNGVVSGGGVADVACTISLQASLGLSVQLKMTQSTLRSNTVSVYNSTSIEPSNLVAVLSSRDDLGRVITSSSNVLTLVESDKQRLEPWSVYWTFVEACVDANDNCPEVIDQVAAFGFDCDTVLEDVDPDTIEFPPRDARTGELIVLPRNPLTGQDFTEAELRQLAAVYLPELKEQYGGRSLAEYCPVSCVREVCAEDVRFCWSENRCKSETCTYTTSAISTPTFVCSADELVNEASVGRCGIRQIQADFCSSSCYAAVGAWLAACQHRSYDVLNEAYAQSYYDGLLLSAIFQTAAIAQCDVGSLQASDDITGTSRPGGVSVLFNSSARHGVGTFLNVANNVLRKPLNERVPEGSHHVISVNNHPLPFTSHQAGLLDAVKALQAVLFIMIAFAFVPGGIVVFVVREKEAHHNSKHQQMISGASIVSFWLSTYAFDVLVYMLPLSLSILSILWVDLDQLIVNGALWACFLLLLGYGLAVTSCTYALSFLFEKHTQAQIIVVLFNVFLGLVLMIAQFVMAQVEDTQYVNALLMPMYRLSPGFCLGHGLFTLTSSALLAQFVGDDESKQQMAYSPLSLMIAGTDCIYLYTLAVFYMLLTIAIDTIRSRPKYAAKFASKELKDVKDAPYDVDVDVKAEAARIESSTVGSVDDELVRLVKLRKVYKGARGIFRSQPAPPKVALKSMSFGLNVGECFGYLGINGAGKTTTMKILTGEIMATSGNAYLGGCNIEEDQERVRQMIGYCPQFDALLDRLTVKEHLELFGRLKGLEDSDLDEAVASVIEMLSLTKFTNKLAGTLSGGNKRKLSVGIALIGGPKILFLDEPSTGVDPVARRFMWGVISRICTRQRDCCIVLTSHVMEEVEALCTRVAVVVGGRMRCLGSNQHLKNRFGQGYCLELKLQKPSDAAIAKALRMYDSNNGISLGGTRVQVTFDNLKEWCKVWGNEQRASVVSEDDERGWALHDVLRREGSVTPTAFAAWWLGEDAVDTLDAFIGTATAARAASAQRLERQGRALTYSLSGAISTSEVFAMAEQAREACTVEEYGVTQSSLEQIFNGFASQQDEEVAAVRGMGTASTTVGAIEQYAEPAVVSSNPLANGSNDSPGEPATQTASEDDV